MTCTFAAVALGTLAPRHLPVLGARLPAELPVPLSPAGSLGGLVCGSAGSPDRATKSVEQVAVPPLPSLAVEQLVVLPLPVCGSAGAPDRATKSVEQLAVLPLPRLAVAPALDHH